MVAGRWAILVLMSLSVGRSAAVVVVGVEDTAFAAYAVAIPGDQHCLSSHGGCPAMVMLAGSRLDPSRLSTWCCSRCLCSPPDNHGPESVSGAGSRLVSGAGSRLACGVLLVG